MKQVGKISPISITRDTKEWQEKKLLENYKEIKEAIRVLQKGLEPDGLLPFDVNTVNFEEK